MNEKKVMALIYILLRDDVDVDRIEEIFSHHISKVEDEVKFSDKYLEEYAKTAVERLK